MATGRKLLQRTADMSGTTAIAWDGRYEVLTEIRDLLHATSDTLERVVNDQDETILLLGALLDITAGDRAPSRNRSTRTDLTKRGAQCPPVTWGGRQGGESGRPRTTLRPGRMTNASSPRSRDAILSEASPRGTRLGGCDPSARAFVSMWGRGTSENTHAKKRVAVPGAVPDARLLFCCGGSFP
jgi:hypothetical protein